MTLLCSQTSNLHLTRYRYV